MNKKIIFSTLGSIFFARRRAKKKNHDDRHSNKGLWLSLLGSAAAAAGYIQFIRPRLQTWGATDEEIYGSMLGDGLVNNPTYTTTRAITIDTYPNDVWPWIVQMGEGRGGFYSYDFIDRLLGLKVHSAHRILPRYQDIDVGDTLDRGDNMIVRALEPGEAMVIGPGTDVSAFDATWAIGVYPAGDQKTRLVSRVRARFDLKNPKSLASLALADPGQFIMEKKFLTEIKTHAEGQSDKWPYEGAPTLH